MSKSLADLIQQKLELEKQIEQLKKSSLAEGISIIKKAIADYNITEEDLLNNGIIKGKEYFYIIEGEKFPSLKQGKVSDKVYKYLYDGNKLEDALINKTDENIKYSTEKEKTIRDSDKYKEFKNKQK